MIKSGLRTTLAAPASTSVKPFAGSSRHHLDPFSPSSRHNPGLSMDRRDRKVHNYESRGQLTGHVIDFLVFGFKLGFRLRRPR